MKIKRLVIENFKSIERIELIEPNPFTVFVGPNGSGKSNIFEALEFMNFKTKFTEAERLFLGEENFLYRKRSSNHVNFEIHSENSHSLFKQFYYQGDEIKKIKDPEADGDFSVTGYIEADNFPNWCKKEDFIPESSYEEWNHFYRNYSRLFVGNRKLEKIDFKDNVRISLSGSNLEGVLRRILSINRIKSEMLEWLDLFVPGLKDIDIHVSSVSNEETLIVYQEGYNQPFNKNLISDGTYNIIAILAAIYQTDESQFLCIEEPENGLNPKVVKELVNLCRYACEEYGHFIWLNTHSQTLVSQLTPDEIILVDKKEGATQIKQSRGINLHGLAMDEAWLSNALGGGLPW